MVEKTKRAILKRRYRSLHCTLTALSSRVCQYTHLTGQPECIFQMDLLQIRMSGAAAL